MESAYLRCALRRFKRIERILGGAGPRIGRCRRSAARPLVRLLTDTDVKRRARERAADGLVLAASGVPVIGRHFPRGEKRAQRRNGPRK